MSLDDETLLAVDVRWWFEKPYLELVEPVKCVKTIKSSCKVTSVDESLFIYNHVTNLFDLP